jgi:hypothetical protein
MEERMAPLVRPVLLRELRPDGSLTIYISSAFTGSSYSSEKYVPKELSTPLTRLNGEHTTISLHLNSP